MPRTTRAQRRSRRSEPFGSAAPAVARPAQRQAGWGNRATQHLLGAGAVQARLTVNRPGDAYEQEADRVADAVMGMPSRAAPAAPTAPPAIQRLCAHCEEEREAAPGADDERVQRQEQEPDEEDAPIQTKRAAGPAPAVGPALAGQIAGLRGGRPLAPAERGFFEPRFGRELSAVRLHTGAEAAATARAIDARAYTHGRNIAFAPGQYDPASEEGRRLLAHELTHVVQQGGAEGRVQRQEAGEPPAGCVPPPARPAPAPWSGDPTLNAIRAEAPGDNTVLVRRGQSGATVQLVQQGLHAWGCEQRGQNLLPQFGSDAIFGGETESAVRSFQGEMGIAQDGLVGPITLSHLDAFVAFGSIPAFPPESCKVVPSDVPASVMHTLADLGFAQQAATLAGDAPTGEQAFSAGVAGVPILCQLGGKQAPKAPPGICEGKPEAVVTIGNATFALCTLTNASRMSAGVVPHPSPDNQVGFVEMRALGIALFAAVGSTLPDSGPGSSESDWQHGFIQTVRSLSYKATYQRGWSSTRAVTTPRRDATGSSVPEPWYSNSTIPSFQFQVGKQIITIGGPISLGPATIDAGPVGILDDPRVIFAEVVPIDRDPECPCSHLETIEAKGELDTWLVVTPAGLGKAVSELGFLKHAAIAFDLKAEKSAGFAIQGAPTMQMENGRGSNTPILTGTLANADLLTATVVDGQPCPVTIPGIKCPIEPPKKKSF